MALTLEEIRVPDYEKVVFCEDPSAGLSGIIAVHNTNLGPACGGIRMLPYASKDEAQNDVLRLARGMSYKSALAGIDFGGGKSVIIGDPSKKTPALFHAFGEALEKLGGTYIAAKDMNIDSSDLTEVKKRTRWVLGIEGEPGSSGDPSPVTSRGVFRSLEAAVEHFSGSRKLSGLKIALQGIGHVGYGLAEMAHQAGAELWVTDINPAALARAREKLNAHVVGADEIYDVECDVFSPNARGAVLNEKTIPRLKCKAIVGAANNQLLSPADGFRLHEKGILYAPDYAVNSGGIINIFIEYKYKRYDESKALTMADGIYDTMREIFRRARDKKTAPFVVADTLAEERLYARR